MEIGTINTHKQTETTKFGNNGEENGDDNPYGGDDAYVAKNMPWMGNRDIRGYG